MYSTPQIHSCCATDIGSVREKNEDRFFSDDSIKLYIVADGMGGHAGGEVAAELAVQSVAEFVRNGQQKLASAIDMGSDQGFLKEFVGNAVKYAASVVHRVQQERSDCYDMGSTLTMLLVSGNNAAIAHVGDSRAYRVRDNRIEQLTHDHTMRAMLIEDGVRPELVSQRYNHILVRSIGHMLNPLVDVRVESLQDGDRFLLCSDGMSNHFTDEEMLDLIDDEPSLRSVIENLINVGKAVGGSDNLTGVIVEATTSLRRIRYVVSGDRARKLGCRFVSLLGDAAR